MADELKIGDHIWRFDTNRRRYAGEGIGKKIIYAEYFEPFTIIGETPRSWIVKTYGGDTKVSKSALYEAGKNGFLGHQWFTDVGKDEQIWFHEHRFKIVQLVESADVDMMRRIADLVGYAEAS